jgi:hypothetical protein
MIEAVILREMGRERGRDGPAGRLAALLHARGDLAAARPLYERALTICEKRLGPEHPYTARSLNNLASLLENQGDLAGARRLHERVEGGTVRINSSREGGVRLPVSMSDLLLAFDFANSDAAGMNEAFLCRRTGKIYWRSPNLDEPDEELPDDIEEGENYISIPPKKDLNLGKELVLDFAAEFMRDDYDKVRRIFGGKGAYRNFKMLLEERGRLKEWYEFEAQATERALRDWCKENSIDIANAGFHP